MSENRQMKRPLDYYEILQVAPRAEREVIEAAYRRLAAKYHPDVNKAPDATERMKRLNAAYGVLSDPDKRRAYDAHRVGSHTHSPNSPPWESLIPDGRLARNVLLPIGLLVFFVLAPRVGSRSALFVTAILVALVYYLVTQNRGRK